MKREGGGGLSSLSDGLMPGYQAMAAPRPILLKVSKCEHGGEQSTENIHSPIFSLLEKFWRIRWHVTDDAIAKLYVT